jgi:hypothetical protein
MRIGIEPMLHKFCRLTPMPSLGISSFVAWLGYAPRSRGYEPRMLTITPPRNLKSRISVTLRVLKFGRLLCVYQHLFCIVPDDGVAPPPLGCKPSTLLLRQSGINVGRFGYAPNSCALQAHAFTRLA